MCNAQVGCRVFEYCAERKPVPYEKDSASACHLSLYVLCDDLKNFAVCGKRIRNRNNDLKNSAE